jgi:hypothetical protein
VSYLLFVNLLIAVNEQFPFWGDAKKSSKITEMSKLVA